MSFQCPRCDQTLNNAAEAEGCRDWQCPRGAMGYFEAESERAAQQAVISAARRLRKARADWDLGCPDSLQTYYHALNAALTALDAMEHRS